MWDAKGWNLKGAGGLRIDRDADSPERLSLDRFMKAELTFFSSPEPRNLFFHLAVISHSLFLGSSSFLRAYIVYNTHHHLTLPRTEGTCFGPFQGSPQSARELANKERKS